MSYLEVILAFVVAVMISSFVGIAALVALHRWEQRRDRD